MIQLTIEVPDELAIRLKPVQNRLIDVLELGLREVISGSYPLHQELAEFLATGPTPQEIVHFRPSEQVNERVHDLMEKNRKQGLTGVEQSELDRYEMLDYFMTMVKARARMQLERCA